MLQKKCLSGVLQCVGGFYAGMSCVLVGWLVGVFLFQCFVAARLTSKAASSSGSSRLFLGVQRNFTSKQDDGISWTFYHVI